MLVSAHQPAYLPWAGLLAKVRSADLFVILDTVPRSHGDFTNRNKIKTQNGVQWLTVPVLGSKQQPLREVRVDRAKRWRRKHWRAVELAYQKAPFWPEYADTLTSLLSAEWPLLVDLDDYLFRWMLREFGVRTQIVRASHLTGVGALAGNALLLALCRAVNADGFLFGALGRGYCDVAEFERAGVQVSFQEYEPCEYPQLHGEFVGGLSALDMLLNVGPDRAAKLL